MTKAEIQRVARALADTYTALSPDGGYAEVCHADYEAARAAIEALDAFRARPKVVRVPHEGVVK